MSISFSLQIKRRIIWRQSLLFGKFGLDALPLVYDTKKSLITKLGCNLVTPLKPRGIYSAGCAYTRRNAAMPQCGGPGVGVTSRATAVGDVNPRPEDPSNLHRHFVIIATSLSQPHIVR